RAGRTTPARGRRWLSAAAERDAAFRSVQLATDDHVAGARPVARVGQGRVEAGRGGAAGPVVDVKALELRLRPRDREHVRQRRGRAPEPGAVAVRERPAEL